MDSSDLDVSDLVLGGVVHERDVGVVVSPIRSAEVYSDLLRVRRGKEGVGEPLEERKLSARLAERAEL